MLFPEMVCLTAVGNIDFSLEEYQNKSTEIILKHGKLRWSFTHFNHWKEKW